MVVDSTLYNRAFPHAQIKHLWFIGLAKTNCEDKLHRPPVVALAEKYSLIFFFKLTHRLRCVEHPGEAELVANQLPPFQCCVT